MATKKGFVRKFAGEGWEFVVYVLGCCTYQKWFSDELEAQLFADYYNEVH